MSDEIRSSNNTTKTQSGEIGGFRDERNRL